jgi:hypothetical protein
MPRGPKGEKRPADVVGNAVPVIRVATGEIEENEQNKDPKAIQRGRAGSVLGGVREPKSYRLQLA